MCVCVCVCVSVCVCVCVCASDNATGSCPLSGLWPDEIVVSCTCRLHITIPLTGALITE